MAMLDHNTIMSLNKDPKSIDLHNLALSKLKNVRVSPTAKHDFIGDRARTKNIDNMDELYGKLNELEKNGVLDIWIKKFGKTKYGPGADVKSLKESTLIELAEAIEFVESIEGPDNNVLILNKANIIKALEEDGVGGVSVAPGMSTGGSGPYSTFNGTPAKNSKRKSINNIINNYASPTLQDTATGKK